MEFFSSCSRVLPVLAMAMVLIIPAYGQISTPCSASMISSFTPCINFITNSTANGTSPTSDCCNALKSITSGGTGCLCLIVTGSIPFQIPINRTLAISLPRACKMPGVPLKCNATGAPIPAPAPFSLGPTSSPSPSPKASSIPEPTTPAQAPESDTTPSPPSPTVDNGVPTATTGSRPVLTPSAATPSLSFSPSLLLFMLGFVVLKFY